MRGSISTIFGWISISWSWIPRCAASRRAYLASSGIDSSRWSSGRNAMVYASIAGLRRWASAVTMLESNPPLRNVATGASATRWASTEASMTSRMSAGGPAAARAATSAAFQYRPDATKPSRRYCVHVPAGEALHPPECIELLRQPVVQRRATIAVGSTDSWFPTAMIA